jgi:AcrR family transcriptional regulator
MSVEAATTPRERRREETTAEILSAAWELAGRDGLAALSLRELGRMVGLRAQSLYAYFDSKAALYDAMFRQGQEQLAALQHGWLERLRASDDPRRDVRELSEVFARWCAADAARYQLLFQRTIPGWQPSADSYALAERTLDRVEEALRAAGVDDEDAVDVFTALLSGLTSQQHSNDPGGDRWLRLVGPAVDMFFDHFGPGRATPGGSR